MAMGMAVGVGKGCARNPLPRALVLGAETFSLKQFKDNSIFPPSIVGVDVGKVEVGLR